jgi:hypothetical protein
MADLARFLAEAARRPLVFGEFDCGLWLADWVRESRGIDAAAHLRGRYHDARGMRRVLKREGGLLQVVAGCARAAGLRRTNAPNAGAIGVVETLGLKGKRQHVGAICTGPRWAFISESVSVAPAIPLAAWQI